ncbi:unnamed protein product, partial [Iphiclides podalirius]
MNLILKPEFAVHLAAFCFITHFLSVKSQLLYNKNETIYVKHHNDSIEQQLQKQKMAELKQTDPPEITDHYSFVALIEIMFNDGSRRNCTGAIIHDNVVLTAAHCFEEDKFSFLQPELTGSFVIIGTKNMYDTGYEQYLPIERVLIHPDYKGWTADLALVYTFAGMMSDKPGNIIPLAEGNSFSSVHSNITVLNWNQIKRNPPPSTKKSLHSDSCSESSEEKDEYFPSGVTRPFLTDNIHANSDEHIKSTTIKTNNHESILRMEEYTIFEAHSCKHLVQKAKSPVYQIVNENKTICYYTKGPKKVQGNSGAPAVHRNHLVALSAGDLFNDEEHIIIGTKISCYCTWIGENLPGGGDHLQCCTDCCDGMSLERKLESYFKRR